MIFQCSLEMPCIVHLREVALPGILPDAAMPVTSLRWMPVDWNAVL